MSSFKKANSKFFTKPHVKATPDNVYWNNLGDPVIVKEYSAIDHISFSNVEPYYFAVTSSAKVQVYNPITKLVYKNLSKFRETAYGGSFRKDGKLLVAGGEDPELKLFDVSSKNLLRVFKGHTGPIHRCYFTCDNTHIASFSDDKSVSLWDIPSESKVANFTNHTDYIRAGATSPVSPEIIISGSYDKTVNMYDTRSNTCVMSVNHGSPVESVVCLPSGGIFVSAGGLEVSIWDMLGGGKLLHKFTCHHKTVTSLCLASGGKRLISASLDHHAKVYDLMNYTPVHTLDYPSPVLSIGVSMNDEVLAAGMINGLLSIRKREVEASSQDKDTSDKVQNISKVPVTLPDFILPEIKVTKDSRSVDQALKEFQYIRALQLSVKLYSTNAPRMLATLKELIRRNGLHRAVIGLDEKWLAKLIAFICKHIDSPQNFDVLSKSATIIIEVLEEMISTNLYPNQTIVANLQRLSRKLTTEQESLRELLEISGALQMIFANSNEDKEVGDQMSNIEPSNDASQNFFVNVS